MNLEQQVVELEKSIQTITEAHHTALEVERAKVRELRAQLAQATVEELALRQQLAQAQDELVIQKAKPTLIEEGWLSPDEAKALQAKIAAYEKLWNDMHFTICKLEQDLRKAKGEQ